MARLRVTLLGGVQVRLSSGRALPVPGRNAQALLGYLGLRPGQAHARHELAGLGPEAAPFEEWPLSRPAMLP